MSSDEVLDASDIGDERDAVSLSDEDEAAASSSPINVSVIIENGADEAASNQRRDENAGNNDDGSCTGPGEAAADASGGERARVLPLAGDGLRKAARDAAGAGVRGSDASGESAVAEESEMECADDATPADYHDMDDGGGDSGCDDNGDSDGDGAAPWRPPKKARSDEGGTGVTEAALASVAAAAAAKAISAFAESIAAPEASLAASATAEQLSKSEANKKVRAARARAARQHSKEALAAGQEAAEAELAVLRSAYGREEDEATLRLLLKATVAAMARLHADLNKVRDKCDDMRRELTEARNVHRKREMADRREMRRLERDCARWKVRAEQFKEKVNKLRELEAVSAARKNKPVVAATAGDKAATGEAALTKKKATTTTKRGSPLSKTSWNEMIDKLEHFRRGYGHCRVPFLYEDKQLAKFVQWLRREHKCFQMKKKLEREERAEVGEEEEEEGEEWRTDCADGVDEVELGPRTLTEGRIAQLDAMNFVWNAKSFEERGWDQWYEDLLAFRDEHGHCNVPRTYKRLGEWVHSQRNCWRFKRKCLLPGSERHRKLVAIGFDFSPNMYQQTKKTWEERFEQLLEYQRKFGHCNVSFVDPSSGHGSKDSVTEGQEPTEGDGSDINVEEGESKEVGEEKNKDLFKLPCPDGVCDNAVDRRAFDGWIRKQRAHYPKFMKGEKCKLDKRRIRRLNQIGFDWDQKTHHGRQPDPEAWNLRFNQLVEYKAEHGNTCVPHNWQPNKQLGGWVKAQRKMHKARQEGKRSSMTDERLARLESIGFQWIRKRETMHKCQIAIGIAEATVDKNGQKLAASEADVSGEIGPRVSESSQQKQSETEVSLTSNHVEVGYNGHFWRYD